MIARGSVVLADPRVCLQGEDLPDEFLRSMFKSIQVSVRGQQVGGAVASVGPHHPRRRFVSNTPSSWGQRQRW